MDILISASFGGAIVYALTRLLLKKSKLYAIRRGIFFAIAYAAADILAKLFFADANWLAVWLVAYFALFTLTLIIPSLRAWFFPKEN